VPEILAERMYGRIKSAKGDAPQISYYSDQRKRVKTVRRQISAGVFALVSNKKNLAPPKGAFETSVPITSISLPPQTNNAHLCRLCLYCLQISAQASSLRFCLQFLWYVCPILSSMNSLQLLQLQSTVHSLF